MKRFIHTSKITNLTNVTTQVKNLPLSTGAGPFISYPQFTPLNPLLNITLPSSSVLNIRNEANILVANGELNDVKSGKRVVRVGDRPLVFNQIYSENTSLSLILSNQDKNNFVNIELGKEQSWVVKNKRNLIGWYGGDLQINPNPNAEREGIQFTPGDLTTKANLILGNDAQLFTIYLTKDEIINLHSPSIIAHSTLNPVNIVEYPRFPKFDATLGQFHTITRKIGQLYHKIITILGPRNDAPKDEVANIPESSTVLPPIVKETVDSVTNYVHGVLYPTYTEVKGPAKIIISNSS